MKRLLIALVPFLVAVCVADEPSKPTTPSEIAPIISKQLPAGWHCISDLDCIVILRDEPVTLLWRVNLPNGGDDEDWAHYGQKSQYMFVLQFHPRLSDDEYAKLVATRQAALLKIKNDRTINIMNKFAKSSDTIDKQPLPQFFSDRFSIYVHRTGTYGENTFDVRPESAGTEGDAVMGILDKLFEKYPAPGNLVPTTRPEP